jgi:ribosomal-protein-alanine N-acetyltransferase
VIEAIPTLETERLILRPFVLSDAPTVQALAGAPEVAATTFTIPHPYPDGCAEEWIGAHAGIAAKGIIYVFAVVRKADAALMGSISIVIGSGRPHKRALLSYWLGLPYWNQGYATEAARRVIAFGFEQLGLNRIEATHFPRNPASGRVLRKAGMRYEGTLRGYLLKGDTAEDAMMYGILRVDWERPSASGALRGQPSAD